MKCKIKIKTFVTALLLLGIINVVSYTKADTAMGTYAAGGTEPTSSATSTPESPLLRSFTAATPAMVQTPVNLTPSTTGIPSPDVVDISSYQSWLTQADFNSLKASGVKTVVIKLTEGTTYTNPYAKDHIQWAKAAGLNVAVYHYATLTGANSQSAGNSQAIKEAQYFATTAKNLGLPANTVMVMDCEQPYKNSSGTIIGPNPNNMDWATAAAQFANELKSLGYANTKFYSSLSWVGTDTATVQMNYNTLGGAKNMWIAQYLYDTPTNNSGWATAKTNNSKFGAWQYTSQMRFQGTTNLKNNSLDTSIDYSNTFTPSSPTPSVSPSISYQTQVQTYGWTSPTYNGQTNGTTGLSLRVEALKASLLNLPSGLTGGLSYRGYVENIGWQNYVSDGAIAGTVGKSLRMEAIQINLTGAIANQYDVYYRTYVQNIGWLGWTKNGQTAGTSGMAYRIEAVQVQLVAKGSAAPSNGSVTFPYLTLPTVSYSAHVQNIGWQAPVVNGALSGTTGKSLRMEALKVELQNIASGLTGGITYRSQSQNVGWQAWVSNNSISGTTGQSLRDEAIELKLTGGLSNYFNIYYRAHVQSIGWQAWVSNGATAGTVGKGLRMEALEIKIVPKANPAP
ncbi:GH25 family lysozyme [Lactococcus protaetiae]|uniref:Lysozyme n=1 Tax=Lactococcus protaetiae TaxID=2592653 RepID=A0A514Z7D4_9LACT|nr:GH25 family lysozyme [Lactococcus protaetiae]QDK70486.1 lysozyme [Lactococcus protaetiae]